MIPLREIFKRVRAAITERDPPEWENVRGDAIWLAELVKSRIQYLHFINKQLPEPQDLCLLCGGYTWGRPQNDDGMDYTRRMCNECGEIRPEPEEKAA